MKVHIKDELRPALINRWGATKPSTNEPHEDNRDSMRQLLPLEVFSTEADDEEPEMGQWRISICGIVRRYYDAIDHPMKWQLPNILGEADARAAFCTAWRFKGYH